ncbi:MAG: hypothetical protein IPI11_10930 [Haliscomenobacter sp.]|nr:hypothetical protein [Haliscomenobacter sp.]
MAATPDRMDERIFLNYLIIRKYLNTIFEAIENGFLVPYTYYGLQDNIDYNTIKHNGVKYNVADLDSKLIIKERNQNT